MGMERYKLAFPLLKLAPTTQTILTNSALELVPFAARIGSIQYFSRLMIFLIVELFSNTLPPLSGLLNKEHSDCIVCIT